MCVPLSDMPIDHASSTGRRIVPTGAIVDGHYLLLFQPYVAQQGFPFYLPQRSPVQATFYLVILLPLRLAIPWFIGLATQRSFSPRVTYKHWSLFLVQVGCSQYRKSVFTHTTAITCETLFVILVHSLESPPTLLQAILPVLCTTCNSVAASIGRLDIPSTLSFCQATRIYRTILGLPILSTSFVSYSSVSATVPAANI